METLSQKHKYYSCHYSIYMLTNEENLAKGYYWCVKYLPHWSNSVLRRVMVVCFYNPVVQQENPWDLLTIQSSPLVRPRPVKYYAQN